jgi:hypothetical protein
MKTYIFYTNEGFAQDGDNNDVENCQVIGWAKGDTPRSAFNNLVNEAGYLTTLSFNSVSCQELSSNTAYDFSLKTAMQK